MLTKQLVIPILHQPQQRLLKLVKLLDSLAGTGNLADDVEADLSRRC